MFRVIALQFRNVNDHHHAHVHIFVGICVDFVQAGVVDGGNGREWRGDT